MRVAVVGSGISGLVSAYALAKEGVQVVLYEKEEWLGGHARTVTFDGVDLDLAFMVFNRATYPNVIDFFETLGVEMETSDMSFSVSLHNGSGVEWGSRNLSSLFAQKRNLFNPYFYQMVREMFKFKTDVFKYLEYLESNPEIDRNETLGQFLESRGYSELFRDAYFVPLCALIWSCSPEGTGALDFSAYLILSCWRNHYLLQIFGRPQWLTVKGRSRSYVNKVKEELEKKDCEIRMAYEVQSVSTFDGGCKVLGLDGSQETFDACILAVHAPEALILLGNQATYEERRLLGAYKYVSSDLYLHRDKTLMPRNPTTWSAWNFLGTIGSRVRTTFWLNTLQNIPESGLPFLATLNPPYTPERTFLKWSVSHPLPSVTASKASVELVGIQGKRGIWFCGAYQGYGFHEDGFKGGMIAAHSILGRNYVPIRDRKQMVPSLTETGARFFVTRFLQQFICRGCLTLLEEGGTIYSFKGTKGNSPMKSILRIHNPQFYWKVATQAGLGLADAYVNGDFSPVDKEEGLLNLFMIYIANRDLDFSIQRHSYEKAWRTPWFVRAGLQSSIDCLRYITRKSSLPQAHRNISCHYDLSNDLFELFLDETMTYSSAIFKNKDEDLKVAQQRKMSLLIEKARVNDKHEVLEIGCGWGSFAIEVVRRTGCKYTGITLSEEQLIYAERKVKDAGLQDHIRFLLCDYQQLPKAHKYDRIICGDLMEAVGHEYMNEFFSCCDSVLSEDGLFLVQFVSLPDECYEEHRRTFGFMKKYIIPGGLLLPLRKVLEAVAAASELSVERLENIGIHYYQTLRCWRKNFLENQSKIHALGFDEKFIRTWEYYFDYCAAGFRTRTIGNYQVLFSRPGNLSAFEDTYEGVPLNC